MAADDRYATIGCGLWTWQPFVKLTSDSKVLWLNLYTSAAAKRSVPGLWPGTLHGMADDARLTTNAAYNALDELTHAKYACHDGIVRPMVEFDPEHRLARLTMLPDHFEGPHNYQSLSGSWTKFRSLPSCPLRDSHIPLMWWLVSKREPDWARITKPEARTTAERGWNLTRDTWRRTYGTISVPVVPTFQPLSSSDTSTPLQPSLFGGPTETPPNGSQKQNSINPGTLIHDPIHQPWTGSWMGSSTGSGSGSGSGSSFSGDSGSEAGGVENAHEGHVDHLSADVKGLVFGPWGSGARLSLVPGPGEPVAAPEPEPVDYVTEARNAHTGDLKQATADVAASLGIADLLPKNWTT